MTKIHHATTKKAAKLGIALAVNGDDTFTASTDEITFTHSDAKVAVDEIAKAMAYFEENGEYPETVTVIGEDDAGETEGDDEEAKSGSVVKPKYKAIYRPKNDSTGDKLADRMLEAVHDDEGKVDLEKLRAVGRENGVDVLARWGHLKDRHGNMNIGMVRMNLGNVLRQKIRQGEKVTIDGRTIRAL